MTRFQLLDTATSEVVVEGESIEEVAEVRADLRDDGAETEGLVLLRWDDDDDHPTLVE